MQTMSNVFRADRRAALIALSSTWLAGCGGGADASSDATSETAAGATEQALDTGMRPMTVPALADPIAAEVPAPAAAPAPAPFAAPPGNDGSVQFLTWDGGSGPNRNYWSSHLRLAWKNPGTGDWTDAKGQSQGSVPFTSIAVPTAALNYEFDATELARRWVRTKENKGFMLRVSGAGSPATSWSGRESDRPPVLIVTQSDGRVVECACIAFAGFSPTTTKSYDTRAKVRTSSLNAAILQFDVPRLGAEPRAAKVRLFCESKTSTVATLEIYECDPPRFQLGAGGIKPTQGIAGEVGEANLRGHPDVFRAGDFSDLSDGVLFDGLSLSPNSSNEQLPDPDAPGSVMFRGSFTPLGRGSFSGSIETMRANYSDPLRPPSKVEEEMFCRLYFFLEDDWLSTLDANKMAIGWNLRMGWWNNAQGGYWQSTRGNGGAPGTGLKLFAPAKTNGGSQRYDAWEYQGHSIRMEAGKGVDDGNPYSSLRPIQSYVYSLDQPGKFGQIFRLGNGVIARGRWHCLEQQIKINSVVGPFDALGNGQAVADGMLRSWLDGVPVSEIRGLRWRRHPEMGVQGPWVNWFYGGTEPTERTMHYRMNHLVVARRYIGPRKL